MGIARRCGRTAGEIEAGASAGGCSAATPSGGASIIHKLAPDTVSIPVLGKDGKLLNLGFETGTLQDWTAEGNAWQGQPVKGDAIAARHRGQSNHVGEYWIGGYEKLGDKGTGRLTSAAFAATHPWASFLIGGGKDPSQTRVEIVEETTGKVIHTASGLDIENMRRVVVDLRASAGKKIFLRLVDESTKGWGHVNFDDFVFHDKEPMLVPTGNGPMAGAAAAAEPKGTTASGLAARQKESPVLQHLRPIPLNPPL